MRPLEGSICLTLLAYVIHILSPSRVEYVWFGLFPIICLPLLAFHLMFEGYRWQMLPVYLALVVCLLCGLLPYFVDLQARFLAGAASLCFLGIGILLGTIFPVFRLPAPTGPYAIGTRVVHLIDQTRSDPVEPDRRRELMIQLWYPAEQEIGRIAAYRETATTSLFDRRLSLVRTHSFVDAPLASRQERYPIVLYLPSWDGIRTENTALSEELASHGYIVVGIDHPHSSSVVRFPDGRVVKTNLPDGEFFSSEDTVESFLALAQEQINLRANDASFVLESLEARNELDAVGPVSDKLDLEKVGIMGFSLGGGAAAQACRFDSRFKACVNLDGLMAPPSLSHGVGAPLLIISGNDPLSPEKFAGASAAKRRELTLDWDQFVLMQRLISTYGGFWLSIFRMRHFDLSDTAFSSPLHFFSHSGAIEPGQVTQIVRRYTRAMFDQYLRGENQPLLQQNVQSSDFDFRRVCLTHIDKMRVENCVTGSR